MSLDWPLPHQPEDATCRVWTWHPQASPDVRSESLGFEVAPATTGWQTALTRRPPIKTQPAMPEATAPRVVSLPLGKTAIRTYSFTFAATGETLAPDTWAPSSPGVSSVARAAADCPKATSRQRTRIKPPGDIIKLEDRLFYVLQPPLEMLLDDGTLQVPFTPFPYQLEGIAFLYPRCHAVLADEMGLGKTMQAITAVRILLHRQEIRRVLIVCPKPLVTNWAREFGLWAPEIPLTLVEGNQTKRTWQWNQPEAPVTIVNYELVLRDAETVCRDHLHFDLVVLDESQRIKNRASSTNQAIRKISRSRSWALTGTPVENSPEDLVGIFQFVSPGYLRSGMKARAVGRAVRDYVLRRTKDRVLEDLPPKLFRDADIELTPEQWESYRQAEDDGVVQLAGLGRELTIQHVFELVLRLKQICNFDPSSGASAKVERLLADIEECATSGRKALVFSQWVQTLTELKRRLARFGPLEYHGQIPARRRDAVIDQFRNDPNSSILLMSYGAGSVGLNLQFASYVFLFDRWWNPAVEDQAINRAHRIGAAGPVTVTRFVSLGTIEQRIDEILRQKRELFDTIFADGQVHHSLGMTQEEIFGLFQLAGPTDAAA